MKGFLISLAPRPLIDTPPRRRLRTTRRDARCTPQNVWCIGTFLRPNLRIFREGRPPTPSSSLHRSIFTRTTRNAKRTNGRWTNGSKNSWFGVRNRPQHWFSARRRPRIHFRIKTTNGRKKWILDFNQKLLFSSQTTSRMESSWRFPLQPQM